jgi:hypothetical protein
MPSLVAPAAASSDHVEAPDLELGAHQPAATIETLDSRLLSVTRQSRLSSGRTLSIYSCAQQQVVYLMQLPRGTQAGLWLVSARKTRF